MKLPGVQIDLCNRGQNAGSAGRGGLLNAEANQALREPAWSITGDRLAIHRLQNSANEGLNNFTAPSSYQEGMSP
jgi:hypothetical protein